MGHNCIGNGYIAVGLFLFLWPASGILQFIGLKPSMTFIGCCMVGRYTPTVHDGTFKVLAYPRPGPRPPA